MLPALQLIALGLDRFRQAELMIRVAVECGAEAGVADALTTELALTRSLAIRGDHTEVWERTGRVLAFAEPGGHRLFGARAGWLCGLVALGARHPESALHELREGVAERSGHPAIAAWAVADVDEAATAVGRQDVATAVPAHARRGPYGGARRVGLRGTALTADESAADELFRAAFPGTDTAPMPYTGARTWLACGSWLIRRRQTTAACRLLNQAQQGFAGLRAEGWTRRATAVLQCTGTGPKHADHDGLTAREHQIAMLAAQGLSNRKIGWWLALSPRTIASPLYRLCPILGVATRVQLSDVVLGGERRPSG
ncbi:helix-turn-helix transcriptional regulator [Streptomyces sp. GESEQ-35]|uniref:helix-turn-helix domain-containing protein n=1 Tax=Streptomyces sp. GESEQ-35 TaxID=2812657 RepID=UPI001B31FB73|nr:helix-turn-helix transcriptional regulator [Streptomyces sp. GESEQ-35]